MSCIHSADSTRTFLRLFADSPSSKLPEESRAKRAPADGAKPPPQVLSEMCSVSWAPLPLFNHFYLKWPWSCVSVSEACMCSVTSGCSQRGSRPTSTKWWRSCSKSSPMRCFTWTPVPSAAGLAPSWGTPGTWRGPITVASSTLVISS